MTRYTRPEPAPVWSSGPANDNDRPYTPETLAERWGCSGRHVRNLLERGELRFFRLGAKLIRIPADAVREYECQQSRSHTQSAAIVADSRLSGTTETVRGIGTRLEPMTRAKLKGRLQRSTQN